MTRQQIDKTLLQTRKQNSADNNYIQKVTQLLINHLRINGLYTNIHIPVNHSISLDNLKEHPPRFFLLQKSPEPVKETESKQLKSEYIFVTYPSVNEASSVDKFKQQV